MVKNDVIIVKNFEELKSVFEKHKRFKIMLHVHDNGKTRHDILRKVMDGREAEELVSDIATGTNYDKDEYGTFITKRNSKYRVNWTVYATHGDIPGSSDFPIAILPI